MVRIPILKWLPKLSSATQLLVGWKEWCALPDLGIPAIKLKVDTGATTSSLHAFNIRRTRGVKGGRYVRFDIHPLPRQEKITIHCRAKLIDERIVINSSGHKEKRCVIRTPIVIGGKRWPIEITLANRETMAYRMLLGREAMHGKVCVDPGKEHCLGHLKPSRLKRLYAQKKNT